MSESQDKHKVTESNLRNSTSKSAKRDKIPSKDASTSNGKTSILNDVETIGVFPTEDSLFQSSSSSFSESLLFGLEKTDKEKFCGNPSPKLLSDVKDRERINLKVLSLCKGGKYEEFLEAINGKRISFDVNYRDKSDMSVLHYACENGELITTVKRLKCY